MKKRNLTAIAAAASASLILCTMSAVAGSENTVNIHIDTAKDRKEISPYIYGVNGELTDKNVSYTALRFGGNRYSAYNWETNYSNAGADWKNISDEYFKQILPDELDNAAGGVGLYLSQKCGEHNNAYSLMTLQLAGYVSADKDGEVTANEKAPSQRWDKVELIKGSEFSLQPDLNDNTVYMDEYVNCMVQKLGDSTTATGIKGYSLDNEPALWNGTHSLMHPEQTTCAEIVEKSVTMSKGVKAIDPNAEIFGPALYGYAAFTTFQGASDWNDLKIANDYRWFIDYYLDEMKKAEDECGQRLLDVLDVHYYTEAKGECGERSCKHYSQEGCVNARLQSTRSLWDESYRENSWIVDTGAEFFPLLPNIRQSIDQYYPGTKLAITEYDFGGSYDISGAIAQADALGIFAQNDVYLATLFSGDAEYQLAAINLYTNYDEQGGHFGNTLVQCESDNIELSTCYASIEDENEDVVKLVITNKAFSDKTTAKIKLDSSVNYSYVRSYGIVPEFAQVFAFSEENEKITLDSDNTITFEMDPRTVTMLVIAKDKAATEVKAPSADSQITDDKKSGKINPLLLGAGGAAVASLGIAAVVISKKKKNKQS